MLSEIKKYIYSAPSVNLSELEPGKTVLVIVDMINGFVNEGALASPRIKNIIPEVSELVSKCREKNIDIIAFADCHKKNAIEFESFPVHCLENTSESEVINEIKDKILTVIPKNSTNGFHAPEFQKLLAKNPQWENFIVCGDCTDICVCNFCITLKTYFNQTDKKSRIIVPLDAVETYDGGIHNADFMNLSALMIMNTNGIEIAKEID